MGAILRGPAPALRFSPDPARRVTTALRSGPGPGWMFTTSLGLRFPSSPVTGQVTLIFRLGFGPRLRPGSGLSLRLGFGLSLRLGFRPSLGLGLGPGLGPEFGPSLQPGFLTAFRRRYGLGVCGEAKNR